MPGGGTPLSADERMTSWDPGVTYGGGGIPERTETCHTISPSGRDDTEAIQAALDDCPADQVVQLTAGTFQINGEGLSLTASNITLRGTGAGEPGSGEGGTRLVKADRDGNEGYGILAVGHDPSAFASSTPLAQDAVQGSDTVRLTEDPGLEVGEHILVDHVTNDDPDVVWGTNHEGPGGASRSWFTRQDRSLSQILEVTAVDGDEITFDTPFHWTFRAELDAQLSRYGEFQDGPVRPFVERVGVEDIYLHGGRGGDYHGNVAISTCAYCWVDDIESDFADGTSVGLYGTYRSEIRDSFIHSAANPNPGGGGYLTGINYGASDNLVENNIMWQGNKTIVMRASGGGNVVAYNYMEDAYGAGYPTIPENGLNAGHYTTPHMELLEGNQAFNVDNDTVWGNSVAITVLRNHLTGLRRDVGDVGLRDESNRRVIALNWGNHDWSFYGNVLGYDGMELVGSQERFVYEADPDTFGDSDADVPMWLLGYNGEDPGQPFDPDVAATAIRHGNLDYATNEVVWDPDLPEELPPSLYLSEKPSFFGDHPWPWVTPDDPDQPVGTLPARERFDRIYGP